MSEVYYYIKETHFSMNYAHRAYSIFKEQKDAQGNLTYGKEMVQCQFVIFGNWLDKMCYMWDYVIIIFKNLTILRNIFKSPMKFIRIENTFMSPKRFLIWHMSKQRRMI